MKKFYKILRALLIALFVFVLGTPMAIYVIVSLPSVQQRLCKVGEIELSKLLATEVNIGSIGITPFNRVSISDVTILDDFKKEALNIEQLDAGIDLYELFENERIVITHAAIIGLNAKLYKNNATAPLNIQNIIEQLKPKDKNKPPTKFDLRINSVVIREAKASFDIISEPTKDNLFDKNHIKVSNLNADIHIPQLKNDDFIFDIKRFSVEEQSGLTLSDLHGNFHIASTCINISSLDLSLNKSHLIFSDINIPHNNWVEFSEKIAEIPLNIALLEGSQINLNDLAPIIPKFNDIDEQFNIALNTTGNLTNLRINVLELSHNTKNINLSTSGNIISVNKPQDIHISLPHLSIEANTYDITQILTQTSIIKPKLSAQLQQFGTVSFDGQLNGMLNNAQFLGNVTSCIGNVSIDLDYTKPNNTKAICLNGNVATQELNIGKLVNNAKLGTTTGDIDFNLLLNGKKVNGSINGEFAHLNFNNYNYNNIYAFASLKNDDIEGTISINDPNVQLSISGNGILNKSNPIVDLHADIPFIAFDKINFSKEYTNLSATIDANIKGFDPDKANGHINISDIRFSNRPNKDLHIDKISIIAQNDFYPQQISISSKPFNASIEGRYSFKTLVPAITNLLSYSLPAIFNSSNKTSFNTATTQTLNDFAYNITLNNDNEILNYFNVGFKLFSPITARGKFSQINGKFNFDTSIPYIAKKNKLIENTWLSIYIDNNINKCQLLAHTEQPTKHGMMPIDIICNGNDNQLKANVNWKINCKQRFDGAIDLSTLFSRDKNNNLVADLIINPSELAFNDSVWTIQRANVHYSDSIIAVENFDVRHAEQYINIAGKASPSPKDVLCIDIKNLSLDYIFQTLEINSVTIGGDATGKFYASELFSKKPVAYTPRLDVKGISYNSTVFGDGLLNAHWDNERQAVNINADITQANGLHSFIYADIFPIKEALDLKFDANKLNASFMRPIMAAFASDVQGLATGKARLYGTFKDVDLAGDIFVEGFKFKIKFTDVAYTATDTIRISPGLIDFKDITIYDPNGNTATLNGQLRHTYFRDAEFDFNINNARNFLCYNTTEKFGENWYGHINGNGFAKINGKPGVINLGVEMGTAPNSNFTFIISDLASANEYKFLTFRDKDMRGNAPISSNINTEPIEVTLFRENIKKTTEASSSIFNMNIIVDVTPVAQMTLVMDPVGGDKIKARGTGQLKLHYSTSNDDVKMYGTYELDEGSYNFTLQDIIIKDFKIRDDSKISFDGDPMAAKLDIAAVYPVKANLSDLDEAFLEDKSVNNTNVPIDVVFNINGIMTQPDIKYKLEFPSFANSKGDIESKVNSIISTEEMMKRQCLYLLALNRFYTPEYMTTTKGNELFSVASSTISSQLSNMLGQLSENWTISPNLRSDLGDFSDVEVDVALSSTLLNNRLRLNGNFGYRDKSLNTNQFIGDFDIEYLLNPKGSWRLKAYNRYNDQNYYLKTATTTQGVGIMYRQDFDNMFSFLKPKKKSKKKNDNNNESSIDSTSVDSITPISNKVTPIDSVTIQY